jgi:hypothetical protein
LSLDPRADSCSFTLQGEEPSCWIWESVAVKVNSNLLADAEELDVNWDWDYLEYQLKNPERYPVPPYNDQRTFHIG